jgi:type II secretory pathway component PulK
MRDVLKKFIPKTLYGFPVSEDVPREKPASQRGIAMMVAVMIISVMMMFVADFMVSSMVNLTRASAQRDNIRAEYLAKSGANWAIWLNLFDYGLQLQLSADPSMKAMKDGIGTLWDKLGMVFPYDAGLDLTQTDKFVAIMGLSGVMDSAVIDIFKSLGGELGVEVTDESGKINLNTCYQSTAECGVVLMQMEALMSCTGVEQDYNRQKNLKVGELARRITDWIDKNGVAEPGSGLNDENEPYQKRKPPYKAKNSPMDSLDELLLVDGWNRELHAYYSPYLTVWPFVDQTTKNAFKVNINTMPQEALRCLFGKELGSPENHEKFARRYRELMEKSGKLAGGDAELQNVISELFGYKSDGPDKGKSGDKASWLTTESRAFRIKAKGIVGEQTRILEYVIQRSTSQQLATGGAQQPWSVAFFRMR